MSAVCALFLSLCDVGDRLLQSHRGALVSNNSTSGPMCFAYSSTITTFFLQVQASDFGFGVWNENYEQAREEKLYQT